MSRISAVVILLLAAAWLAAGNLRKALPPDVVVILAGPTTGSFHEHAQRYKAKLTEAGLKVQVQNLDNSSLIIDRVQGQPGAKPVHIGFTAQAVDEARYPQVNSAAVIELQPLFVFLRPSLAGLRSPAGLLGRRLVLPAEASATAQAARAVLAAYGVTPQNTAFTYLTLAEAVAALRRGEHDAGFFMLSPGSASVRQLALDPQLTLFSFDEAQALTRHVDSLRATQLPRGAFDLRELRPARDTGLVGAPVNVVVRQDLHPAVLYALLNAMKDLHKGQTLVSNPGDYPSAVGAALPLHPVAQEWGKSGTPWLYQHLPPWLAGLVDAYWGHALLLLAVVSAFGTLGSLNDFFHKVEMQLAWLFLLQLQRRLDAGKHPGFLSRALFRLAERVVVQEGGAQKVRDQLNRLRPRVTVG